MKSRLFLLLVGVIAANSYANVWSWFGNSAGDDGNAATNGNGAYAKPSATTMPSQRNAVLTTNNPVTTGNQDEISYDDTQISLPLNKNTLLCFVNATNKSMVIDHVGGIDNGDWDGPNPHNILPGTVIPSLQSICKKMVINTYHRSAPVEPFIKVDNSNNTISWRTDQYEVMDYNNAIYTPNVYINKDSNPGQYKLTRLTGHYANTFIISDSQYNNENFLSNWMAKIPANKKLKDIMMMGSHDAGIAEDDSIITFGVGGYARNTITQKYGILDQLKSGVRYFDLRVDSLPTGDGKPMRDSDNNLVIVDSGDTLVPVHSGKGCTSGELGGAYPRKTMDSTMSDIVGFIKTHTQETVILNFSHQCKNDLVNANIKLLSELLDKYNGPYYYKSKEDNFSANLQLKDLRGKIVILLDGSGYETLANPESGYFTLRHIYDHYADQAFGIDVERDQIAKFKSFANDKANESDLFLMNWTSTVATRSIQAASAILYPTLSNNLAIIGANNLITPNIANVDFVNPMMGSLIVQRYYKNSGITY